MGKVSEGSDFDNDWKEKVEDRVNNCKCVSELYEDEVLDRVMDKVMDRNEILRNIMMGGGVVMGVLLKYGGEGMVLLLEKGLTGIVNCLRRVIGSPGNYGGITLLSVVGKVICKTQDGATFR